MDEQDLPAVRAAVLGLDMIFVNLSFYFLCFSDKYSK